MANFISGIILGSSFCGWIVGRIGRKSTERGPEHFAGICLMFHIVEKTSMGGLFLGSSILLFGKTRRYLIDRKNMIEKLNKQNPHNKI